jgi:hypothetical protein
VCISFPCNLHHLRRFRRQYPDSALAIENERLEAAQAALFGVFAAHALLLAFSLKLKMSAALHQPDKTAQQQGEQQQQQHCWQCLIDASAAASFAVCRAAFTALLHPSSVPHLFWI